MGIEVRSICKQFGAFTALDNVSLNINSGELVALLGPSGSGKTTLLRIIAGMETADTGEVLLHGETAQHKKAGERNVGFVFQHYALFRHMTVFDNIAFGLQVRPKETRPSKGEIRTRVFKLLSMVHLESFHNRYPHQLSGGQRQRVALARALAVEPKLLLLDEPFGALDAKVRQELRRWLRRLHDEIHVTSVFVTHDQEEAMEVADRVVVMSNGRIEQVGTPEDVYHHPCNGFVYDFLGNYNEFQGWQDTDGGVHLLDYDSRVAAALPEEATEEKPGWLDRLLHKNPGSKDAAPPAVTPYKMMPPIIPGSAKTVKVFARPHDMDVVKTPPVGDFIAARVVHVNPAGALVRLELERLHSNGLLQAEIPHEALVEHAIRKSDVVYVRPKLTRVFGG